MCSVDIIDMHMSNLIANLLRPFDIRPLKTAIRKAHIYVFELFLHAILHPSHQHMDAIEKMLLVMHRSESYLRQCEEFAQELRKRSEHKHSAADMSQFLTGLVERINSTLSVFPEHRDFYKRYSYPLEQSLKGDRRSFLFDFKKI